MSWWNKSSSKQKTSSQQKQMMQKQQQIDQQIEAKTQLLKSQIDSMFDVFQNVITYLKTDQPTQAILLTLNDSAVSLLKLLGSTCKGHINDKEENVLKASWAHFITKKQELGTDGRVIKHWINYAECALLGKKLNKLKLSKITVDAAHKHMEQGGLQGFMNSYAGVNHESQEIVKDAQINRGQYKLQNQTTIVNTQQMYEQRKGMINCPDQHKMYDVVGGGQNIQYASSLYHPTSKYYNKEEKENQQQQQQSGSMDVDNDESNNDGNNDKQSHKWNAYVISPPSQTILRGNKPVSIKYPYPCIIAKGMEWENGQLLGVTYAKPNDDLRVRIKASNLERDPVKVSKEEQKCIFLNNLTGDEPLGYKPIPLFQ